MRRRASFLVLVFVFVVTGTLQGATASTSPPVLTRLRLVLTSTGEWASLRFGGGTIRAHHVSAASPGSTVRRYTDSIFIGDDGTATTTVDLVLRVPPDAETSLVLAKSKAGEARARVVRTNGSPVVIADIVNRQTSGPCVVTVPIARSTLVGSGLTVPLLDPRRLVMAFYYPWFENGELDKGPWYDTPSGAYRTESQADVSAMVNQAADSGVQGFIVSWDARYDRPQRFDYVLNAAEARGGFYAAPVLELLAWRSSDGSFNLPAIEHAAALALDRANRPGFLRMTDGRPVLLTFASYKLGAANWRTVADRLRARGYSFFTVGDSPDPAFGYDGAYYYDPNPYSSGQLINRYTTTESNLRLPAMVDPAVPQRLWAATVSPGKNTSYTDMVAENTPRDDGARYDMTWNAALVSNPEWVLITSWNEWYEATHIAPSQRFGSTALQQTAGWSSRFKNPAVAPPPGERSGGGGLLPLRVKLAGDVMR